MAASRAAWEEVESGEIVFTIRRSAGEGANQSIGGERAKTIFASEGPRGPRWRRCHGSEDFEESGWRRGGISEFVSKRRSCRARLARGRVLDESAELFYVRSMPRFRVMTYNVHQCIGVDGQDSVAAIASLCDEADADLVALQELDAPETDEDEGAHHARDLAARLSMQLLFCRTFRRGVGYYGHALLSRHPIELKQVTTFPSLHASKHPRAKSLEPRGAIWGRVTLPGGLAARETYVDVVSTHLGLRRRERAMQAQELLSERWLSHPDFRQPHILCGDLNAVAHAATYRRFASRLRDAQRALAGHRPKATFPSRLPVLRLDHVFVSDDVRVHAVRVPSDGRARRASDHLPLVVDLELP